MTRRADKKAATRARIVQAAWVLFEERGYEPATMRDIAKLAGVSTGAIFSSFKSKTELLDAVLEARTQHPVTRGLLALRWIGRGKDADALAALVQVTATDPTAAAPTVPINPDCECSRCRHLRALAIDPAMECASA